LLLLWATAYCLFGDPVSGHHKCEKAEILITRWAGAGTEVDKVTLHWFAGQELDWEEQRTELIEGLLSSSSPSQLAMQEAVSVLLYMAQDDTSSSGGDSPQVIPFDYLISLAILVMLAFA